ncbi:MAG: substrate-binding domain-containing protein [Rudaea sp.]|uniref:PstS family phosphate ABC transporter substrate-binding protein n=1 Tax=Rudaea sp. TaxID=2136325 RepID=UPI0039E5860B
MQDATRISRRVFLSACAGTLLPVRARAGDFGSALPRYAPKARFAGTLRVSGADTMRDLVAAWAREFRAFQPDVKIDNAATKLSADGVDALLAGRADVVTYVREPFAAEVDAIARRFGHAPGLVNVAGGSYATKSGTHALAIFVNAANPITHISLDELDAIYSKDRRRGRAAITTWGQLGLTGDWADKPIRAYGMLHQRETGNPPGIVNYFRERVLRGGEIRDGIDEQVDRPGETALDAIVHRVAEDPAGIGYSGFAYAAPGTKTLRLAETPRGPYYAGTPDEVARRVYPLSRQIYLGFRASPDAALAPALREFLAFVLSRQGQKIVAEDRMRFIALTPAQAEASRRALRRAIP